MHSTMQTHRWLRRRIAGACLLDIVETDWRQQTVVDTTERGIKVSWHENTYRSAGTDDLL